MAMPAVFHLQPSLAAGAAVCLAGCLVLAVYRLFLHPLSRYHGSPVAALSTSWYEWYWNYHKNGKMLFEIERLHRKHGPVVRIGVNDIHINDPHVYLDMTKVSSRFTKDPFFYQAISFPGTSIGETDPGRHRARRRVLSPAFSGSRVQLELAPGLVLAKTQQLMGRFAALSSSSSPDGGGGEVVCFSAAAKAFTMDIVATVVLGRDAGCVADPRFRNDFIAHLQAAFELGWTATAFPVLSAAALRLAARTSVSVFPLPIFEFKKRCLGITLAYLDRFFTGGEHAAPTSATSPTSSLGGGTERSAVIDMMMDPASGVKGHRVPTPDELNDELLVLLTAGNDTTSNSMIVGTYQIRKHPGVYSRLNAELDENFPCLTEDLITYDEAKSLPYLTAVIKEILRFGSPFPGRLPRRVPPEGYSLHGHHLPGGTVIHFSPYMLNRHPAVWDRPNEFDPDRWLGEDSAHLDKYMASFNRGARQCLGKDLAWCELLVLFANFFRRFHVNIHKTTDADMEWSDLVLMVFKKDLYITLERKVK